MGGARFSKRSKTNPYKEFCNVAPKDNHGVEKLIVQQI